MIGQYRTFTAARAALRAAMLTRAIDVHPKTWQGMDVSHRPEMRSQELLMELLTIDLAGITDLDHWRHDINPNLPWADDHFEERVCGYPINPGVEWENWPWATSADKHRDGECYGPHLPHQDWAYLAGLVDGEGTIYWRDQERWQGCLRVYQKDRMICDYLLETFRVGKVASNNEQTKTNIHGKEVDNHCFYWQVNSILEMRWVLFNLAPYLRIKKPKAEGALTKINRSLSLPKDGRSQLKKVWDQDWAPRFNHNYMQRLWPKGENGNRIMGMEQPYGDLKRLVEKLAHDPHSRQIVIPLYFPEDTGANGRMPCTLLYQFIRRDDRLHIYYPLRSCDFIRHWDDDCYLAVRLLLWVLDKCVHYNEEAWKNVVPGTYTMHMSSLHVFENDRSHL